MKLIRCTACKMHLPLCICALLPSVPTRTHVLVVLHNFENKKSTSTGVLASRCLPNSRVLVRGRRAEPEPECAWPPETQPLYLYPRGTPIQQWSDSPRPVTLIVPDGTWGQAARFRRRVPGLLEVPCVSVDGGRSAYRLRRPPFAGALATIEAIARALGVLEGPEVQRALEELFLTMVERTLSTRGVQPAW
jgi:DTW domain-containing protein YfiP